MTSDLTLITVTYNSAATLTRFWSQWRPENARWIVVDNASTDGSADVAAGLGAEVIRLSENLGFSTANNIGLARTESEYVGFLNPDVTVGAEDLGRIVRHVEAVGGIAAPQLFDPAGGVQPNGRGRPTLFAKLRNRLVESNPRYHLVAGDGELRHVDWLMGAAVFTRTRDMRALGGWDEDFFIYYEDADLGLRARAHGLPVTVCGCSRAIHGWARDTSKLAVGPWKHEFRAAKTFYCKHPRLLRLDWASRSSFLTERCNHA